MPHIKLYFICYLSSCVCFSALAQTIVRPDNTSIKIRRTAIAREYKAKAQANLSNYISQSGPANLAKTCSYAKIFLKNPTLYKWAGLAALASGEVGKMSESWKSWPDRKLDKFGPGITKIVLDGNQAIYQDLFWQYLLAEDMGLDGIKQAYAEGAINKSILNAWTEILSGTKEAIWNGNKTILRHEQEDVAQSMYEKSNWFKAMSELPKTFEIVSPVPKHQSVFPNIPQPFARHKMISNFSDRWEWVETQVWPDWRSFDSKSTNYKILINSYLRVCPSLKNELEDFQIFIHRFSKDPAFQKTRFKFPSIREEYVDDETIVHNITASNWKYDPLLDPQPDNLHAFINMPSISKPNTASVMRTCKIGGCGVGVEYVFKLIGGKWYYVSGTVSAN